jgi:hypothetical protein
MLSASTLADANEERQGFIRHALVQVGIDADVASNAVSILVAVAITVKDRWGGYIQRFLREQGQRMVKELQNFIAKDGLEAERAARVAALWLQNAANMPIMLSTEPHVTNFCKHVGISASELLDVADKLELNVAVLDDLLAFEGHYQRSKLNDKPQNERKRRMRKDKTRKAT